MANSFPAVPDPNALRRYVESTGENGFVDSKAACAWEGEEVRASLAKDIVAFANSGGGGAIVIGKETLPDGRLNITGVSDSQAASFDTTKVANWINERFDPPVVLTCSSYSAGEQTVVVIEVDEFGEQPSMCTKECGTNRDKWQLKQGAIYVRTQDGESKPLQKPKELRHLIDRAVLKRHEVLKEVFDKALAGNLSRNIPTAEQQFDELSSQVFHELQEGQAGSELGGWKFYVHPGAYEPRWLSFQELAGIIERRKFGFGRSFPQQAPNPVPRDWGISGGFNGQWGLATEGLFAYCNSHTENQRPWRSRWTPMGPPGVPEQAPAGKWLSYNGVVANVCDFAIFASRFAEEFESGVPVRVVIEATGLKNRRLLGGSAMMDDFGFDYQPTKRTHCKFTRTSSGERRAAEWRELAADAIDAVCDCFPLGQVLSRKGTEAWIDRYVQETGNGR